MSLIGGKYTDMAIAGGILLVGYLAYKSGKTVTEYAGKVWEGVTFDKTTLGPQAELTKPAELSMQEYIEKGYIEVLPGGGTRITPAGEAYISGYSAGLDDEDI